MRINLPTAKFARLLMGALLATLAATGFAAPAKPKAKPPTPSAAPAIAPAPPPAGHFVPEFVRTETGPEWLSADTCTRPEYPKSSLRNEETGTVTLYMVVAASGELIKSGVSRSSGFSNLDKAALAGLKNCLYRPGSINGVPEQMTTAVQYVWTLE
ncbi:MAG: energy transducer TonB [Massilia sp.]